jgi:L-ascorbate metabolism protein UlaG (beta-lactamase superfamily)
MSTTGYRLADHVIAEPLVSGFTAWWCTIAPITSAMHVRGYQIPILDGYLADPETSYQNANEPALAGGPFVGIPPRERAHVESLVARLRSDYADSIALAEAIEGFTERLMEEAKGQTLEPYYSTCPEPLKGLVEFVYDYHNRPSIRFDEGLLYRSPLYKPHLQGLRLHALASDEKRPFYVSTPHLPRASELWELPLSDGRLRELFALDTAPASRSELAELLGGHERTTFFSEGPARCAPTRTERETRVRYFGHATVLIEHGGVSVLVDPVIPVAPEAGGEPRLSYDDLPARIDFVAVTHMHADHFHLETLMRLGPRIGKLLLPRSLGLLIGDVSMKRVAHACGLTSTVDVDTFDGFREGDVEVVAAPFLGEHGDIAQGSKVTYVIRAGKDTFYLAADSTCLEPRIVQEIAKIFGSLDNVFMNTETEGAPISWPIQGLFPKKRNRALEATRKCRGSNYDEGVELLRVVRPKRLFNYAMGLEPWVRYIVGPASPPESPRMKAAQKLMETAGTMGVFAKCLRGAQDVPIQSR